MLSRFPGLQRECSTGGSLGKKMNLLAVESLFRGGMFRLERRLLILTSYAARMDFLGILLVLQGHRFLVPQHAF